MSHDTARAIWAMAASPTVRNHHGATHVQFLVHKATYLRDVFAVIDYVATLPRDITVTYMGPNIGEVPTSEALAARLLMWPYSRCKDWFEHTDVICLFLRIDTPSSARP